MILDKNSETFIIYMLALKTKISIYLSEIALIANLQLDKALN